MMLCAFWTSSATGSLLELIMIIRQGAILLGFFIYMEGYQGRDFSLDGGCGCMLYIHSIRGNANQINFQDHFHL